MWNVCQDALLSVERLQKSSMKQVSHSGAMESQGIFEEKEEEQKMLTFPFTAVEAL